MSKAVKLIWAFLAVAIGSITEPTTSKLELYVEEDTTNKTNDTDSNSSVDVAVQTGNGMVQKPSKTQDVLASEEFAEKLEGMVKKISAKKLDDMEKEVRTLRNQLEINAYDLKSFKRQLNKLERIENETLESVKKDEGTKTNLNLEAALVQSNALNKNLLKEFDGLKQKIRKIENDTRAFDQKGTNELHVSQKTVEKIARKAIELMRQEPERPKRKPQRKPKWKPHVDKFPSFFDVVKALPRSNFEAIENCQTFTNIVNFNTPKFIQTTVCNNLIDSNALEQLQNAACDVVMENIYSYTIVNEICDLNQTSGDQRLPLMRMKDLREQPVEGNWLSKLMKLGKHRKRSYFNRLIEGISRNSSERAIVNTRSTANSLRFDQKQINNDNKTTNNDQSTAGLFKKLLFEPILRKLGKFIRPIRRPTKKPMNPRPIIKPINYITKPLIQSSGHRPLGRPSNGKYPNSKPKPAPKPTRRPTPRPALKPRPKTTPKPTPMPLYYDLDEDYPLTTDYETPNYEQPKENSKRKRIVAKLIGQIVINLFERVSENEDIYHHNPNVKPRSVGETQSNVTAGSIINTLLRLSSNKAGNLTGNLDSKEKPTPFESDLYKSPTNSYPSSSSEPYSSSPSMPVPRSYSKPYYQEPYPGLRHNNFPNIQHRTNTIQDPLHDAGLIRYIKFPVDEQRLDVLRKLVDGSLRLRENSLSKV